MPKLSKTKAQPQPKLQCQRHSASQWRHYYQILNTQKTDPVTLYLSSLAPTGRRSVSSLLNTAANLIQFDGELENMPWYLVQFEQVMQIRNSLKNQHKSANTINLTLAALRGISKTCLSLGLISAEQWWRIKTVKRVPTQREASGHCLRLQELKRLHRCCQQDHTPAGQRDHALIALLLATGLRRSEVCQLDLTDYHPKTGLITVRAGKGNQYRTAYLTPENRMIVNRWVRYRGKHAGPLFTPVSKNGTCRLRRLCSESVYQVVKRRTEQAGLSHITPHDLRRTFVTQLLSAGVDLNTTRQLVGHADLQTTARYDLRDERSHQRMLRQVQSR